MAILNQKRILNLIPKTSAPVTIHVSQGDVGTEIEFTLVKGDELFVNTGSLSASVHGIREDGANFGVFTCTLSGSSVKFPLHAEMTAVKGSAIAEIVLVDSQGNKVGSSNFGIMVEESVFPLGVTYDNDVSVYESILAYAQTIPAQVQGEVADLENDINSLNGALAQEVAAREAADNALDARINQIVAPSGEAPSAEEVTDARVGADGITYPSLGTAIRTQIGDLDKTARNGRVVNAVIETNYGVDSYNSIYSSEELEIIDDTRHQIMAVGRTKNIKTAEFDSDNVNDMKLLHYSSHYNFAISDENGNLIFRDTPNRLKGKKVSIIGDSISSFDGYNPTGYASYYPKGNVQSVNDTWWKKLIDELEMELLVNASWSGSRVSGDSQGTAFTACSDARISDLSSGGVDPEVILIYITTNDWANSPQVPIGSFDSTDDIPAEGTIFDISKAYALMLYKIRTTYPAADVFCFTNFEGRLTDDTSYPILNTNSQSIHQVNHAIMEVAHIFGAEVIDLETIGIHFWNVSTYTWDGTLHPNKAGMELIKEATKCKIINKYYKEGSATVNMGNILVLKNADFSSVSVGNSKLMPITINSVTVGEGYVTYNSSTHQIVHSKSPSDQFSQLLYTSEELTIPNEGAINLYGVIPVIVPTADVNSVLNASDASPYNSNLDMYYMYFHNKNNDTWNRRVGIKKTYKIYARKDGVIDGTYTILLGDFKLCDISSEVADKYYMQWCGNIGQGANIGIEVPKLYWGKK